jgi:SMC interacting uncharacterized protein involved in chromosome segregation
MKEKELLQLKAKIETAEQSVQQLKGRKKELLVQLKEDFKCNDLKQSKAKRKELENELETIKEKFESKVAEIEKKYNGTD